MTNIGTSAVFDGDLTCNEDVTVDGHLKGNIQLREAALTIGRSGEVHASISAPRVVVHGKVTGSISGGERIELTATAVVSGDLSATQIVMADGATFNGRVDMARRTVAAKVAQYKAGAEA